jgi:hypothetical protein
MTTPMGTAAPAASSVVNADASDVAKVGVFTTAQSLVTFPGAVAGVTTVWKVLGAVNPAWGESNRLVPVVLALLIGGLIYLSSVSKGAGWRRRLGELGIALVNSCTIAAAALGIA